MTSAPTENGRTVTGMIEEVTIVRCKDCEYSYEVGFVRPRLKCEKHPELDAYFICSGEGESYEIYYTPGMKRFMVLP